MNSLPKRKANTGVQIKLIPRAAREKRILANDRLISLISTARKTKNRRIIKKTSIKLLAWEAAAGLSRPRRIPAKAEAIIIKGWSFATGVSYHIAEAKSTHRPIVSSGGYET
jgi:hypothetical protein